MLTPDQAKELDNFELCEELGNKLEVLSLCVEAIISNHKGIRGLSWAFEDADTLAREMRDRFPECPD